MDESKAISFKGILQQLIEDNFTKRAGDKIQLLEKAQMLLEIKEVQRALLLCDWKLTVQTVGSLARMECDENMKKSSKGTRTFKIGCFKLWKEICHIQCSHRSPEVKMSDMISTLTKCLVDNSKVWCTADMSVWHDTVALVTNVFSIYSASDIPPSKFRQVWRICIKYLKESLADDKRAERQKLCELLSVLIKNLRYSELSLHITEIIKNDLEPILREYSWPTKDSSKSNLLEALNNLCENYYLEIRNALLDCFFTTGTMDNLGHQIELFPPRAGSILNTASDEQCVNKNIGFQAELWRFFEWILVLSMPDCVVNFLNYEPDKFSSLVEHVTMRLINQLSERIQSSLSTFRQGPKFVIPSEKLPLISRLFVLQHFFGIKRRNSSNTIESTARPKKRSRRYQSPIIEELVNSSALSHIQILLEIMKKWKHRLDVETIHLIADSTWKLRANVSKDGEKLHLLLEVLTELVEADAYNGLLYELFNWVLPLLHRNPIHNSVSSLLLRILVKNEMSTELVHRDFLLSTQTFNVLINNIARLQLFKSGTLRLIEFLISHYDFDEASVFRAELISKTTIKQEFGNSDAKVVEDTKKEWTFRIQLISATLCDSEISQVNETTNLLLCLLCYHPHQAHTWLKNRLCSGEPSTAENLLSELYSNGSSSIKKEEKADAESSLQFIDALIESYVNCAINILNSDSVEHERKLFLWKITAGLLKYGHEILSVNESIADQLNRLQILLDDFVISNVFTYKNLSDNDKFSMVNIGNSWPFVSTNMKSAVNGLITAGSHYFYLAMIHWEHEIPDPFLMQALENYDDGSSRNVEAILSKNAERFSFTQLILILRKFGLWISQESCFVIVNALINKSDEDHPSDVSEENSQRLSQVSSQLMIPRKSTSKQGQNLWKSLAASAILKYVKPDNIFRRMADGIWETARNFIVQNAPIQMLATRFYHDMLASPFTPSEQLFTSFNSIIASFSKTSPELLVFLRNCLNKYELCELHAEALRLLLTSFDNQCCVSFIPHLDQYVKIHESILCYFLEPTERKYVDSMHVERSMNAAQHEPILCLLRSEDEPLNAQHFPDLFFLPRSMITGIIERDSFTLQLADVFESCNYLHVFCLLRQRIYNFSTDMREAFVPSLVLYPMFNIFGKLQFESKLSEDIFAEIASIVRMLVAIHIEKNYSDDRLRIILVQWIEFVSNLATDGSLQFMNLFKTALQIFDVIVDHKHDYPQAWTYLTTLENSAESFSRDSQHNKFLNFARSYCRIFTPYAEKLPECFSNVFPKTACDDSIHVNGNNQSNELLALRGYWMHILNSVTDDWLKDENLVDACRNYFLYPHLRAELATLISFYNTESVQNANIMVLKQYFSSSTIKDFLKSSVLRLLHFSRELIPSDVVAVLYKILLLSEADKKSNGIAQLTVPGNGNTIFQHNEIIDVNELKASEILAEFKRSHCFLQFPEELQAFLPIADRFTTISYGLLPRITTELENKQCTTKKREELINFLNDSIISRLDSSSLLYRENEIMAISSMTVIAEYWYNDLGSLDLLPFARCLARAKLFKEALYYLKYYLDFSISGYSPPRATFLYDKNGELFNIMEATKDPAIRNQILDLLVQIYINLNDPVLLSALPLYATIKNESRIFLAETNRDWGAASTLYSTIGDTDKMADTFYYLGSESIQNCSTEYKYNSALKLASWDQLSSSNESSQISFPKSRCDSRPYHSQKLYGLLRLFHDGKAIDTEDSVSSMLKSIHSVRQQHLPSLKIVEQLRDFVVLDRHLRSVKEYGHANQLQKPNAMCLMLLSCWELASTSRTEYRNLPRSLDFVLQRAKQLRKEFNSTQPALKLLDKAENIVLKYGEGDHVFRIYLERSKLLISNKETAPAAHYLTRIVEELSASSQIKFSSSNTASTDSSDNDSYANKLKAKAHVLLSKISTDDKSAMDHLQKACMFSRRLGDSGTCSKNFVKYAIFAEKRYQEIRAFSETQAFALKEEAVNQWQKELDSLPKRAANKGNDRARKEREIECERHDIKKVSNLRTQFLKEASRYYLDALEYGSISCLDSTVIYRFAALLMQNVDDEALNSLAMQYVDRIPSWVWLPVLNLLSSYLFSSGPIAKFVSKVAFKAVKDHPYHSFNHLLFYICSSEDKDVSKVRKETATALIKKIMETDSTLKQTLIKLKRAHDIFREFGKADIAEFEIHSGKSTFMIPRSLKILSDIDVLRTSPIPILTQKLKKDALYTMPDIITFHEVEKVCERADGLSAPKVIKVMGSDGIKRKIIFKKEDLRQDELIQQIFRVANLLLEKGHPLTSSNSKPQCFLPLGTYNVLPLDNEQGLIEWCQGTTSLCGYLAGPEKKTGAHRQYYPNETSVYDARVEFSQVDKNRKDCSEIFFNICRKISPVFRFFFYERFLKPETFHERILSYTQSLAQWSIVCYIVGLGDRHLSNILIHEETAELVHIDLGMIFEYSQRLLKIPEKVPFRLTRELVDPILVDGINGRLKDIAVHTLRLMRENAQVLIGISSLILHDPISTFKSDKMKTDKNQRNLFAEMAILRLKEKLAGRDLTYAEMNAPEQVAQLIKDARDPENLSRMFAGWMPFL
ncbi:phosphatidylinositol 3- and 4-kinase domain-containing protein [Ditylenchus destructor]|uniref:non-specific serine/threonine protein kinase n=1 Tax=Ditylenchus destructor TaxID=166010 RepID=A0AAD4NDG3_9BILA|nr:phosphatidylinositol 3- and 4-kinase domain-containing protein [Ditylenchus destructor]